MKKAFLGLLSIVCAILLQAQILPEQTSLSDALKQAAKERKLVLIIAGRINSADKTIDYAFTDNQLLHYMNDSIICLRIKKNHPDFLPLQNKCKAGYFFICALNEDGIIIGYNTVASSLAAHYINFCNRAYKRVPALGGFLRLERKMQSQQLQNEELLSLIETRKAVGYNVDSLLDVYTKRIPINTFYDNAIFKRLTFLSPAMQSYTGQLLFKDMALLEKVFFEFPVEDQEIICRQITDKSLMLAAKNKSLKEAEDAANFAQSASVDTITFKVYIRTLLDYYLVTRDTANFLSSTVQLMDNYYINEDIGLIAKSDSAWLNLQNSTVTKPDPLYTEEILLAFGGTAKDKVSLGDQMANKLSWAAENFYQLTGNVTYLQKAITWARKANDLRETWASLALLSKLLYFDGQKTEALELAKKAVEKEGLHTQDYWTDAYENFLVSYKKMQRGENQIDNKKFKERL